MGGLMNFKKNIFKFYLVFISVSFLYYQSSSAAATYESSMNLAEIEALPIPVAVIDLSLNTKYIPNSAGSVIDPNLADELQEKLKPIENDFVAPVARLSSAYKNPKLSATTQKTAGIFAIKWLHSWAKAGALLGIMSTNEACYERKWFLATVSIMYLKVKGLASLESKASIDDWINNLAEKVLSQAGHTLIQYATDGSVLKESQLYTNNHYYWEGLAVLLAGKILNKSAYIDFGKKVFYVGVNNIQTNGFLDAELHRFTMSYHYHVFAAAPLVMMEDILLKRNLISKSPKLGLLVSRIMKNYFKSTSTIIAPEFKIEVEKIISELAAAGKTLTGVTSDQSIVSNSNFAFLTVYYNNHKDDPTNVLTIGQIKEFLTKNPVLFYGRLGGEFRFQN